MKLERKDLIYSILIVILLLFGYLGYRKIITLNTKFDNYENTISALNDSIQVTFKNGFTTYSKQSPEILIKELINSEYFKTLSKDQQDFYLELNKIKRLISATQVELEKQGVILQEINSNNNPGTVKNDSISFKLGNELKFRELDTTKKLQWESSVILDTTIKFNFTYKYNFKILTTYERQKDQSIKVNYKLDDPDLKINTMQNFIIPIVQPKTGIGRWYNKNKKTINTITGGVLFLGGGYLGYNLAK